MLYDNTLKPRLEKLANDYYCVKNKLDFKELSKLEDEIVKQSETYVFSKILRNRPPDALDDMRQSVRLGILQAIRSYDPIKGTFCTHVIWQARDKIGRDNSMSWVKVPAYMKDLCRKLVRFQNNWNKDYGVLPPDKVIMEEFGWEADLLERIKSASSLRKNELSIDGPDRIDMAQVANTRIDVANAMKLLNEQQLNIVKEYYFNQKDIPEIAKAAGINSKQVKEILDQCMTVLVPALQNYA